MKILWNRTHSDEFSCQLMDQIPLNILFHVHSFALQSRR